MDPIRTDPIRVLYIGDRADQRRSLAEHLEVRGCSVALASCGAEGLAAVRAGADGASPLEVVVCDYQLQQETGLEVLGALRRLDPELPLIILTSHGSIPLVVEAIKQGAFQFITKPYDPDALEVVVGRAREHRLMQQRLARDASEREALEEELRRRTLSLERVNAELATNTEVLQAILDSSPTAILMVDLDGRITASNRATGEMFGVDGEVAIGQTIDAFLERIEPCFADRQGFRRLAEQLKREPDSHDVGSEPDHGRIFERMLEAVRPQRRYLSLFCAPVRDRCCRELGRVWVCSDVTQLKAADEQLHMIVDLSPVPLIITRVEDGEILFANQPLGELVGIAPDELIGQRSPDFYCSAEDRTLALQRLERDGELRNHEVCYRRADGTTFWALVSMATAQIDGRRAIIGAINDISEMKRVVEDLEQANLELKQTHTQLVQSEKMAALGMLVAGIAHEINTPVGAINSTHSTLVQAVAKLKKVLQETIPERLDSDRKLQLVLRVMDESNQVIESAAGRVTSIVRRLRSFARLDEAELKAVDLHEGLEDTLALLHHELKRCVELVRDYGELPRVPCYPGPLNQVFLNLLVNAKQAIADKGTIGISTRVEGDRVLVEIRDDGHGIDPETVKRIFDPGFTTKGVGVGTGLGLSICYRIMQDHHGKIRVESQVGEGSTFTVVLPRDLDKILGKDL